MNRAQICLIVGTRPQLIKASQLQYAHTRRNQTFDLHIIDTGQHYDAALSSSSSTGLTSRTLLGVQPDERGRVVVEKLTDSVRTALSTAKPNHVVTIGDTNTTLAATLAATDLDFSVTHIEAGLRSGDRAMPEERNRIVADHLSDHLLAPSQTAVENLSRENLISRTIHTGDLSLDRMLTIVRDRSFVAMEPWGKPSVFMTVHRVSNLTGERFEWVLEVIEFLAKHSQIILPAHPRLAVKLKSRVRGISRLSVVEPMSHAETLAHLSSADLVVTDSGGIQREAFWLSRRCVTLRDETEWTETLMDNRNVLLTNDSWREDLLRSLEKSALGPAPDVYGDGQAAEKILDQLELNLSA